jgi:hypothetical protein
MHNCTTPLRGDQQTFTTVQYHHQSFESVGVPFVGACWERRRRKAIVIPRRMNVAAGALERNAGDDFRVSAVAANALKISVCSQGCTDTRLLPREGGHVGSLYSAAKQTCVNTSKSLFTHSLARSPAQLQMCIRKYIPSLAQLSSRYRPSRCSFGNVHA